MIECRRVQGSITVEAVFVFPIVLFIIIALLYMSFIMHDHVVVNSVVDEANERFNQAIKEPTNYKTGEVFYDKMTERSLLCRYNGDYSVEIADMKSYIKEQLEKKLMISNVTSTEVEKAIDSFSVEVSISSRISVVPALTYLKNVKSSDYERESGVYNSPEYVRAASVSLDTMSQIKGFDKIVSVIDKINNALN